MLVLFTHRYPLTPFGFGSKLWYLATSIYFAPTKYCCWQNIRVDKMLALTKYLHLQSVNKILPSTKCWRLQNIRVNKMLAHVWKHLFTVLAQQSSEQMTSPRPRWCSPTSPCSCWSLHVQSPSVLLPLAALLLCTDSLPHCTSLLYRPAMQKTSQILASTKYRRPPRFS